MRVQVKEIIRKYCQTASISQTAVSLGISRFTVSRWLKRARGLRGNLKWRGIYRQSTRPKAIQYKLTADQQSLVLQLYRQAHFGPRKLQKALRLPISPMTVHRFLKRKGLVNSRPRYRRPLYQNGACMRPANTHDLGFLQMDTKHVTPEWSGLAYTVYEYSAIDILSRYRLAVLLPDISDESARLALEYFLKWFPFTIKYVQTDNGLEFQRVFHHFCLSRNIDHFYIHKNSPNENAVVERAFRTDQDEFYAWLEARPAHIGQLNDWLQRFIIQYNTVRPHQSLDYKTPREVVVMYQMS